MTKKITNRFYGLTYYSAVTEKELVELRGEGGEQAAECGHQAAKHGGDPCAFSSAK